MLLLIALPPALSAYRDGPPANMTGALGDTSCHQCHLDNPLNAPGGALSVAGVPPVYTAGRTYRMTVRLERDGMRSGGFQVAARFASGARSGRQAGAWRILDQRVQLVRSDGDRDLVFAEHTALGSTLSTPGANVWILEWTAPEGATAPVGFSVAGNAADDDASPLGDYIYLENVRAVPPQVSDLAGAVHTSRRGVFPRRRAVRRAACFRPEFVEATKCS